MAQKINRDSNESRSLPAIVALISLSYNLLFVVVCSYLPDDPLYLGQSVLVYASVGCVLSLLGFAGIVTRQANLVVSFANYLVMDAWVSAIVRFFALQYSVDAFLDEDICSGLYASPWQRDSLSHDVITSAHGQKHALMPSDHARRCHVALGALQIVLIVLLMALTALQGTVAISMRRFGREMERANGESGGPASANRSESDRIVEKA